MFFKKWFVVLFRKINQWRMFSFSTIIYVQLFVDDKTNFHSFIFVSDYFSSSSQVRVARKTDAEVSSCPKPFRVGTNLESHPGTKTSPKHTGASFQLLGQSPWWYFTEIGTSPLACDLEKISQALDTIASRPHLSCPRSALDFFRARVKFEWLVKPSSSIKIVGTGACISNKSSRLVHKDVMHELRH